MTITIQCENCRKDVAAPDEAAGKRGKCPYCGHSNYIPAPVADDEILDLAPVDEEEERRLKEERHRLHEQAKALLDADKEQPAVPLDQREAVSSQDVQHLVVNYCLDMYSSRLDRLRTHVTQLRKHQLAGLQAVEEFATDRIKEPALKSIPPRALKAFLAQLKEELKRPG
jgi:phage FluMu protein Com